MSDATYDAIHYSINQEEYLRTFLKDGEIPMDNNCAEGSIRNFTIRRKNWMVIDTISGAKASAVIYSLVETAKANNLHIYRYFEYLLTELPKCLISRLVRLDQIPSVIKTLRTLTGDTDKFPAVFSTDLVSK